RSTSRSGTRATPPWATACRPPRPARKWRTCSCRPGRATACPSRSARSWSCASSTTSTSTTRPPGSAAPRCTCRGCCAAPWDACAPSSWWADRAGLAGPEPGQLGGSQSSSGGSMAQDAVALIKADHRKVEQLFREFEEAGDRAYKTKRQLVEQITRELEVHAAIEEETYYPAVEAKARKDGRELVAGAVEGHPGVTA